MTRTCSQLHCTDKYSEHNSIIWPVWLNGWVFNDELSGSGFESSCSHLNFRFRACFEQGVPWHSTLECGFSLKRVRDMTRTYSQYKPIIYLKGSIKLIWIKHPFGEAVAWKCSVKKMFIEISQYSQESTCASVSFLIKLQASAYDFIEEDTLAQVFSCEFRKNSRNKFSYRAPRWLLLH